MHYQKQYTGCLKSPKYGPKDGPLRFCQSHKRAGMYTNRNGNTLVASRDGNGEIIVLVWFAGKEGYR